MKKINFLILFSVIFLGFCASVAANNIGRNVYGIFTETFDGIIYDSTNTGTGMNPDGGWMGVSSTMAVAIATVGISTECQKGLQITTFANQSGTAWVQFGYRWPDPWNQQVPTDMSYYYGGNLEFWVKTSSDIEISIETPDWGMIHRSLESLAGTGVIDGYWHFVSTPLAVWHDYIGFYQEITIPVEFDLAHRPGQDQSFWVDNVLWVSSQTGTLNVTLKNIVDNSTSTSGQFSWSDLDPVFNSENPWKRADQYIVLDLDYYHTNWGIEIYTDNKGLGADPPYTGANGTDPAGLIDTSNTSIALPMCWGIVNSTFTGSSLLQIRQLSDNKLYSSGYPAYLWMKDRHTPTIPYTGTRQFVDGEDYVTVWDNRGIQWQEGFYSAPNDPHNLFRTPSPNFIYIGAKFSNAYTQRTYKTSTLTIELFYE